MHSDTADDVGKLILRLTVGLLILLHGIAKLTNGIDPIAGMVTGIGLPAAFAYGVFVGEIVAPILLVIGFYARIGAALIVVNMVVAILLAHAGDLFTLGPQGGWALELQGLFLFGALALVFTGPGRLSLNGR